MPRIYPKVVVRHPSPNQSVRLSWPPSLIMIHDTEGGNVKGTGDLLTLGRVFDPNQGGRDDASCTVGTDEDGHSGRYVSDRAKAWQVGAYNSASLGIEQVGFASQNWRAKSKDKQIRETARWVAYWSRHYNIPIQHGGVSGGAVTRKGVLQHRALGALGGGHVDVSEDYPIQKLFKYARRYRRLQNIWRRNHHPS